MIASVPTVYVLFAIALMMLLVLVYFTIIFFFFLVVGWAIGKVLKPVLKMISV